MEDMKREILFEVLREDNKEIVGWERIGDRGQWEYVRINRDEWLLGAITDGQEYSKFIRRQFTGQTDKNGTKIFEGDVVKQRTHPCSELPGNAVEPDPLYDRYKIRWDERRNGWNAFPKSSLSAEDFNIAIQQLGGLITWPCEDVLANPYHYEVIGNIHEPKNENNEID